MFILNFIHNLGRQFDKDGNFVEWWSEETVKAFEERAQCFVNQYNSYIPPELIEAGLNKSVSYFLIYVFVLSY